MCQSRETKRYKGRLKIEIFHSEIDGDRKKSFFSQIMPILSKNGTELVERS